ncbi:Acg family FMN-binding oxidoreductase [Streptomonospora arabica]|uniref:Acg family FMN-binding oxidoreductase n=1 Tax=Streptomonospora arabica TaxID=412417 RepID=A0ABV9SP68_9ACTN
MDTRKPHSAAHPPLRAALQAGQRAPSVANTRPWILSDEGDRIALIADTDQRLDTADPQARELLISCGAALYNVRAAMRAEGRTPEVAILPDPDRPGRLAEIAAGPASEPDDEARTHARAIGRRRTHRGLFAADIDDLALVRRLGTAAAAEGATLQPLTTEPLIRCLAGLVSAAEHLHRHEHSHPHQPANRLRTAPSPDSAAHDFPTDPDGDGSDALFPRRDHGHSRIPGMPDSPGAVTGTLALLTTTEDTRAAWLAAGQALQRVLLAAAAEGVSAAFHTQPLEEPALRAFTTTRLCDGAHPQMILRLGRTLPHTATPTDPPPR